MEEAGAQKFRSLDELKRDFAAMKLEMKTDLEILRELLELYKQPNLDTETKLSLLTDLEYYVHQVSKQNTSMRDRCIFIGWAVNLKEASTYIEPDRYCPLILVF